MMILRMVVVSPVNIILIAQSVVKYDGAHHKTVLPNKW